LDAVVAAVVLAVVLVVVLTDTAVILALAHKHTECLAPELCGLPSINRLPALAVAYTDQVHTASPPSPDGSRPCCWLLRAWEQARWAWAHQPTPTPPT
jgi:hypothetical protein